MDLTEENIENLDPCPDIHALFVHYNDLYFEGRLGACSVEWSTSRMTLCAGVCHFQRGGGCRIKLSEPLLKYRPTKDLKETLLHEMIHAYMFLEGVRDRGDHGPKFQAKMNLINAATADDPQRPASGYNVTIYHSMHDEVNNYRRHWWQCQRCDNVVKRAMNRPPQEADCRGRMGRGPDCQDMQCLFHMHVKHCGGEYVKIRSPEDEGHGAKKTKKRIPKSTASAAAAAGSSDKSQPKNQPSVVPTNTGLAGLWAGTGAKLGGSGSSSHLAGNIATASVAVPADSASAPLPAPPAKKPRLIGTDAGPSITRFFPPSNPAAAASKAVNTDDSKEASFLKLGTATSGSAAPSHQQQLSEPMPSINQQQPSSSDSRGRNQQLKQPVLGSHSHPPQRHQNQNNSLPANHITFKPQQSPGPISLSNQPVSNTSQTDCHEQAVASHSQENPSAAAAMQDDLRQRALAAALARMQGTASESIAQSNHNTACTSQPVHNLLQPQPALHTALMTGVPSAIASETGPHVAEVIDLLDSQDSGDLAMLHQHENATAYGHQSTSHLIRQGQPLVIHNDQKPSTEGVDGYGSIQKAGMSNNNKDQSPLVSRGHETDGLPLLTCPVCCQQWKAGAISNQELNAHIDECLTLMSL